MLNQPHLHSQPQMDALSISSMMHRAFLAHAQQQQQQPISSQQQLNAFSPFLFPSTYTNLMAFNRKFPLSFTLHYKNIDTHANFPSFNQRPSAILSFRHLRLCLSESHLSLLSVAINLPISLNVLIALLNEISRLCARLHCCQLPACCLPANPDLASPYWPLGVREGEGVGALEGHLPSHSPAQPHSLTVICSTARDR